jgi:hypothetical protein
MMFEKKHCPNEDEWQEANTDRPETEAYDLRLGIFGLDLIYDSQNLRSKVSTASPRASMEAGWIQGAMSKSENSQRARRRGQQRRPDDF